MAATGAEIASAYVAVTVKAPGIGKDIAKQLGGVDTSKAGSSVGKRFAGSLGRAFKAGGLLAGGVLAAGIAAGAAKGLARLNAIDVAGKKMKGLGFSAKDSAAAMENALASVKGTAHGLGDAATTASQMMSAGIKPGKNLETVLKSVANTASAAGVGMGEMGSIYAKVASLGKAQNDSLQQVADRGLPIYQKLSEQMGVTTEEVFKMASAGKIGFADFEKAMTAAAGNVAAEMGNTVGGSWANFTASLGRMGAGVFSGLFPQIVPVLQALTKAFGPLETVAGAFGEKLGAWVAPVVEKFVALLNGGFDFSGFMQLASSLSPLGIVFKTLQPVLPAISSALGDLATVAGSALGQLMQSLLPPLSQLLGAVGGLVAGVMPAFVGILKSLEPVFPLLASTIGDVAQVVGGTLSQVLPTLIGPLKSVFGVIGELVRTALPPLANMLSTLAPVIGTLLQALAPVVGILVQSLTPIVRALSPIIGVLAQAMIPLVNVVAAVLTPVIKVLGKVLEWVAAFITGTIIVVIKVLSGTFKTMWAIVSPIISAIRLAFAFMGGIIAGVWKAVIKPVWDAFASVVKVVWNATIAPIIAAIRERLVVLGLATRIMYERFIKPAWDAVSSVISTVWGKVKSVLDTMSRVVKTDPKKAFELARDAIGLAWRGIQDLAKKPVKFVVETVIGGMIDSVNGFLPKGMKLPKPKLPKGFSDGGYTGNLGPSTVAGVVHGNEHVIRAQSRNRIEKQHPGVLDYMNRHGRIPGYRKGGLVSPLKNYAVSQPFHGGHNGIDLAAPMGTPIMAAASGVAQMVQSVPMGGNEIYLQHAGLGTRYSHLSRFSTREGQKVRQGQVIGYVGSTGMSTGPHLHYMVHNPSDGGNGRFYRNFVNPAPYLTGAGKQLGEAAPSSASILDGLVDFAVSKVKAAFPDGGMWIDIATGLARNAAQAMTKAFNPFAASDGHTQIKPMLYDQGGWLPPGLSLVNNKTGVPEPVFNRPDFDDLIGGRGGSLDGTRMVLVLDDGRELSGYVREIADDAVDQGFEELEAAGRRVGV